MKTVYEAASAVEAHMLADLLKQEGLSAEIQGAYLPGAVGELPAAGLVRLVVDEADFAEARAAIERWNASQVSEQTPPPVQRKSTAGIAFVLGLSVGIAASYAFFRLPASVDGVDHNRDGLLDEKWTSSPSGATLKIEADRNLDRKIDHVTRFDERGHVHSAESDDDFNGVFETHTRFRAGNADMSEVDTDGDGSPDLRWNYSDGVLTSTEYINPSTGLPLRVEFSRLGKLTRAEVDSNKDGSLDTRLIYSPLGEVSQSEPMAKK